MNIKTIQNPNAWQLGGILLPAIISLFVFMQQGSRPLWAEIMFWISACVYIATLCYFCLKQKCYGQLILNIIAILVIIIPFEFM